MATRKIIIKRRKRPEVLRMPASPLPRPSYGAGDNPINTQHYLCAWCFTDKKSIKEKCKSCGRFATATQPQSKISQVYVEDNPIFSEN